MSTRALVVIDVQNHFAVEKAADLPRRIAEHIDREQYDHVLFTKFRNLPTSNFHKILHFKKVTESPATDIHPILEPYTRDENIFEKFTYSAFKSAEFVNYLQTHNINEILLCGINIDGCVLASAYEAFDLGYKVKIIEELSSVASFRDDYEESAKVIITRNLKRKPSK